MTKFCCCLVFRATIVHGLTTYWTDLYSPILRDASVEPPRECSATKNKLSSFITPGLFTIVAILLSERHWAIKRQRRCADVVDFLKLSNLSTIIHHWCSVSIFYWFVIGVKTTTQHLTLAFSQTWTFILLMSFAPTLDLNVVVFSLSIIYYSSFS